MSGRAPPGRAALPIIEMVSAPLDFTEGDRVRVIVLSDSPAGDNPLCEALEILGHTAHLLPLDAPIPSGEDPLVVDARSHVLRAKNALARAAAVRDSARLAQLGPLGFTGVNETWLADDFLAESADAAEIDARLRIAAARGSERRGASREPSRLREAGIEIDEGAYTARVQGRALNLTYKEFELIKFLASSPDRVFSREELLSEVWGYDYFGGTRTVDVHVRRLRAKLGPDHEGRIRTVRNVGYLFARGEG